MLCYDNTVLRAYKQMEKANTSSHILKVWKYTCIIIYFHLNIHYNLIHPFWTKGCSFFWHLLKWYLRAKYQWYEMSCLLINVLQKLHNQLRKVSPSFTNNIKSMRWGADLVSCLSHMQIERVIVFDWAQK